MMTPTRCAATTLRHEHAEVELGERSCADRADEVGVHHERRPQAHAASDSSIRLDVRGGEEYYEDVSFTPPMCPSCGQPASEALAGPEHGWECRNERARSSGRGSTPTSRRPRSPIRGAREGRAMEDPPPRSVLIVADRTAATPALLDQVRTRATAGACRFKLLVSRPLWDPDTDESAITLELAVPLLEKAAGGRVEGLLGDSDPFHAVSGALASGHYDEVIISTLPARISHWLHIDLPARVQRLGVPVTVVTARKADRQLIISR